MTPIEKAIRDFCGHHADWWPSTTQVQEMLALAQPCPTCEALARTVMLDQTSHDTQRKPLTDEEIAVERALDNLLYWTERAVNKGNANLDIEEAMQQYNDALAAAHGIKE
jgi:bacterioferritin-associated ferredoxin